MRILGLLLSVFLILQLSAQDKGRRHPGPNIIIKHNNPCPGDSVIMWSETGGFPFFTSWNIFDAEGTELSYIEGDTIQFHWKVGQNYRIDFFTENGHPAEKTISLNSNSEPSTRFDIQNCANDSMNLLVPDVICFDSLQWNLGNGIITTDLYPRFQYDTIGMYHLELTIYKNGKEYRSDSSYFFFAVDKPSADFSFQILEGTTVEFLAVDTVIGVYYWDFGDGDFVVNDSFQMQHTYIEPGIYYPELSTNTVCGQDVISKEVNFNNTQILDPQADLIKTLQLSNSRTIIEAKEDVTVIIYNISGQKINSFRMNTGEKRTIRSLGKVIIEVFR